MSAPHTPQLLRKPAQPIRAGCMTQPTVPPPWRIELAETLRLAWPMVLANLLYMSLSVVDVLFVARLGQEALAASSLAIAIFMLTQWALSSLTGAVAPLIAAERGRKLHAVREIRRSVRMALWLGLAAGLAGMVICTGGEAFMRLTGQNPALTERAQEFLTILSFAMVPLVLSNVLRMFVSAMGRPILATAITALAIGANVLGNYCLVFGNLGAPALGLPGSGWSTVIVGVLSLFAYGTVIQFNRQLRRYHIFGRLWRPDWRRFGELAKLGLPIGLTVLAEGGLFSSAAFLMGRLGELPLAAHTLALQIAAMFFQIAFGLGQAAAIRVGFHYGARDNDGIRRAGMVALGLTLGFQLVSACIMLAAPRLLLTAYLDPAAATNAALVALAVQYLMVAAAFQLADGFQAVAAGVLRGLQDTRVPMLIALAGYWLVGFVVAAWLGFGTPLAGTGVWIGLAAGLMAVAILLVWRWRARERLGLLPA